MTSRRSAHLTVPTWIARAARLLAPAALALAAGGALAPRAAHAEDWTSFGGGLRRGLDASESMGRGFTAEEGWRHDLPPVDDALYHTMLASPAAGDGFVVVGTYDRRVRALDETTGQMRWEHLMPDSLVASPTIAGGRVYALTTDGRLAALDLADGAVAWTRALDSTGYGSVAAEGGALYVAAGNPKPRLLRLDAATGDVVWTGGEAVLHQAVHSTPIVAGGHVIVGEMDGTWHSFAAADGALEWTAQTKGIVQMSSAVVSNDRVFVLVGGEAATLHAFRLATGEPLPGWPLTVALPTETAAGTIARTKIVTSSVALAGADRLAFVARRAVGFSSGTFSLREFVVGVDVNDAGPTQSWTTAGEARPMADENSVPSYGVAATPAAFSDGAGHVLLAVPSALEARLTTFDAASGSVLGASPMRGVMRSSPVAANAGLVLATDDGGVTRWAARGNTAPAATTSGFSPADDVLVSTRGAQLSWTAPADADGDALTFIVRWDDDGEILRDWDGELTTKGDETSVSPTGLAGDRTYTWSVRTRDAKGALSAWSAHALFKTIKPPTVSIGDRTFDDLDAALAAAVAGDTITLGEGRTVLRAPVALPAGVRLRGAGPHLTVLDGDGLDAAVVLGEGTGSDLRDLTVTGAKLGVRVDGGAHELRNVIVRDNTVAGVRIAATAAVDVICVTVMRNGVGVDAAGTARLRNVLVSQNGVGVQGAAGATFTTRYSNVFANHEADRRLVDAGMGDLTASVLFVDEAANDLRLRAAQPTTDRGDPADAFDQEPAPNGGRVNIGAFGNTVFAELSGQELGSGMGGRPSGASPVTAPMATGGGATPDQAHSGCGCAVGQRDAGPAGVLLATLLALAASRRRRR
jgi:MYXO-CTERM domain-containing protein